MISLTLTDHSILLDMMETVSIGQPARLLLARSLQAGHSPQHDRALRSAAVQNVMQQAEALSMEVAT